MIFNFRAKYGKIFDIYKRSKKNKNSSRCSFIYIGREFNFHHEGISTASGWGKTKIPIRLL